MADLERLLADSNWSEQHTNRPSVQLRYSGPMSPAQRLKTNAELLSELASLPDNQSGEVIDGSIYVMGRPSGAHQNVEDELTASFRRGGPGGKGGTWVILSEVSVRFPSDEEVVPDVTGWHTARFGDRYRENPIRLRPDWVCEISSDSTRRKDLGPKRDLYARHGVPHLWIVHPDAHVLEAFELVGTKWQLLGTWSDKQVVTGLAPFPEMTIDLDTWWE